MTKQTLADMAHPDMPDRVITTFLNLDSIMGTPFATIEVGGMEGDVVIDRDTALYFKGKLDDWLGTITPAEKERHYL